MRADRVCRRCRHSNVWHAHFRAGTECSATGCTCSRFRRRLFEPRPGGLAWTISGLFGLWRDLR